MEHKQQQSSKCFTHISFMSCNLSLKCPNNYYFFFMQVWSQVRSLMEKNATLEMTKRNLEDELERVSYDNEILFGIFDSQTKVLL